jgi:hypothetical protein
MMVKDHPPPASKLDMIRNNVQVAFLRCCRVWAAIVARECSSVSQRLLQTAESKTAQDCKRHTTYSSLIVLSSYALLRAQSVIQSLQSNGAPRSLSTAITSKTVIVQGLKNALKMPEPFHHKIASSNHQTSSDHLRDIFEPPVSYFRTWSLDLVNS